MSSDGEPAGADSGLMWTKCQLRFLPVNVADLDTLLGLTKSPFNISKVWEIKSGSVSNPHGNNDHKHGGFEQPKLIVFPSRRPGG